MLRLKDKVDMVRQAADKLNRPWFMLPSTIEEFKDQLRRFSPETGKITEDGEMLKTLEAGGILIANNLEIWSDEYQELLCHVLLIFDGPYNLMANGGQLLEHLDDGCIVGLVKNKNRCLHHLLVLNGVFISCDQQELVN